MSGLPGASVIALAFLGAVVCSLASSTRIHDVDGVDTGPHDGDGRCPPLKTGRARVEPSAPASRLSPPMGALLPLRPFMGSEIPNGNPGVIPSDDGALVRMAMSWGDLSGQW